MGNLPHVKTCCRTDLGPKTKGFIVFLALASLVGCQGLSAGSPSNQQTASIGDLQLSSAALGFGNVVVGSNNTLTVSATNTGTSSVTITSARASTSDFSLSAPMLPLTISPGQIANLNFVFTPSAASNVTGTIALSSNASDASLTVSLSGTGIAPGQLVPTPSSINFGAVLLGGTQTQSATLANTGGSTIMVSQATVSGAGFQLSGLNLPITLNPGQSTNVVVSFSPQSNGAQTGSVSLTTSPSMSAPQVRLQAVSFKRGSLAGARSLSASNDIVSISLSGSGTTAGQLSVVPTSLSFPNVEVGTNQSQSVTLSNSGGSSISLTQALITGSGFSLSGMSLPLSLTAGQSTTFQVVFAPQVAGTVSGNVAFTSNASNSTLNLPLSGAALAPGSLTTSPTSVAFGSVQVGSSQQQSAALTNTGGTSVTISQASVTGAGFRLNGLTLPVTLAAGQSANLTITFLPQSAGSVSGSITITSNAPNPTLTIPLSGTGTSPGVLNANPPSLSFGSVEVGTSTQLSQVVTNAGGSNVTISQYTVTGSAFSVSGLTTPLTLTPGQSYTFTVNYAPRSAGTATGSLSITSNASNLSMAISLSGTGTAAGQLAVSPTTLSFSNVVVGTSASQSASLSASGSSVTVTSGNFTGSGFSLSGVSFPLTIQAGSSASFTVTFTPQTNGAASSTLTFASNATNAPSVQSLSGTGTAPPVHTVVLSWAASTSSNVSSYNVYRGTTSGGPYTEVGSVPEPTTTYTDTSVTDGQTYYYVTTTVNSSNQESSYSNQAKAVIPPP